MFCLILNKQSLGFQNMKLLFPKSHDKYICEACKGKMTALTRTLLFRSAASPPPAEIMNVRRIVIIDNTAGSVTVCFHLISNKQSLGF